MVGLMHFHQAIYAEGPATEKSPTRFINLGICGARLASTSSKRASREFKNAEFYDKFTNPMGFKIYKDLYSCPKDSCLLRGSRFLQSYIESRVVAMLAVASYNPSS